MPAVAQVVCVHGATMRLEPSMNIFRLLGQLLGYLGGCFARVLDYLGQVLDTSWAVLGYLEQLLGYLGLSWPRLGLPWAGL